MNSTTVTEKIAKNSRGLLLLPHTVYSSVQLTMFKWVWNGDGDGKKMFATTDGAGMKLMWRGFGMQVKSDGYSVDGK